MPSSTRIAPALVLCVAALALLAAGCGGGDAAVEETSDSPAATETEATEATEATETTETTDTEASAAVDDAPPPTSGQGTLWLADGRTYAIAIAECAIQPGGTVEVSGTSDGGATFTMTQFYLDEEWSRSDASIELANGDRIFVLASPATPDTAPAKVDGKAITWEQVFQELDESANAIVYTGNGSLRLTCP